MDAKSGDQYSKAKTRERLTAALRGAFGGPPTPLKDIPKKGGESRQQAKKKPTAPKKS
jgi:hypothetical protein